jgi:hypothetical protein
MAGDIDDEADREIASARLKEEKHWEQVDAPGFR